MAPTSMTTMNHDRPGRITTRFDANFIGSSPCGRAVALAGSSNSALSPVCATPLLPWLSEVRNPHLRVTLRTPAAAHCPAASTCGRRGRTPFANIARHGHPASRGDREVPGGRPGTGSPDRPASDPTFPSPVGTEPHRRWDRADGRAVGRSPTGGERGPGTHRRCEDGWGVGTPAGEPPGARVRPSSSSGDVVGALAPGSCST